MLVDVDVLSAVLEDVRRAGGSAVWFEHKGDKSLIIRHGSGDNMASLDHYQIDAANFSADNKSNQFAVKVTHTPLQTALRSFLADKKAREQA